MTNKLHNNYIESDGHTTKLDNSTWQDIKAFFMDNYKNHSIKVTTGDEIAKNFTDFDRAGEYIITADTSIRKIQMSASDGEQNIKIDYTHGMWSKQPTMLAEVNHAGTNERRIKDFLIRLKEGGKPKDMDLYNYMVIGVYLFFLLSNYFRWFESFSIMVIIFILVVTLIILNAAYNEFAWGRKQIIFWLDEKKKNREIKKSKTIQWVVYASCVLMLVYSIIDIFFG